MSKDIIDTDAPYWYWTALTQAGTYRFAQSSDHTVLLTGNDPATVLRSLND